MPSLSRTVARRYSDKEKAAIWALHCQNKGPTEIMRILNAEDSPLGYPMTPPLPRRSCQIILRRLEKKLGPPVAGIKPGEEDEAIDAIRREGLAAIRRRVAELTAKQDLGEELSPNEVRALEVAVRAADGAARRAREIAKPTTTQQKGRAASETSSSALLGAMSRALVDGKPVPDGALIKDTEGGDSEGTDDSDDSETSSSDGDSDIRPHSLDPSREHAVPLPT